MNRPTNALSHHNFVQISETCMPQRVTVGYRENDPFVLPGIFDPYLEELRAYWEQESPGLKDFQSIVHVGRVETTILHTPNGPTPAIYLDYAPTSYFQFLFSNYSLDIPLTDGTTLRQLLTDEHLGTIKARTFPASEVGNCTEFQFPNLGNSLGITIALTTIDQQFIAAKRSDSCTSIARDKGNWLCVIGTQVKRHQERFFSNNGIPVPHLSAQEGLKDEMGEAIAATCETPVCTGLVYRNDFQHCELLYQTQSSLRGDDLIRMWKETEVPDRREFAEIQCIDVGTPNQLLAHLSDTSNTWSPQHAAGAIHYLASKFPEAMLRFGLSLY